MILENLGFKYRSPWLWAFASFSVSLGIFQPILESKRTNNVTYLLHLMWRNPYGNSQTYCFTKPLYLSFFYLQIEDSKSNYLIGLLRECAFVVNELTDLSNVCTQQVFSLFFKSRARMHLIHLWIIFNIYRKSFRDVSHSSKIMSWLRI